MPYTPPAIALHAGAAIHLIAFSIVPKRFARDSTWRFSDPFRRQYTRNAHVRVEGPWQPAPSRSCREPILCDHFCGDAQTRCCLDLLDCKTLSATLVKQQPPSVVGHVGCPEVVNPNSQKQLYRKLPTGTCGIDQVHQPLVEGLSVRASISSVPLLSRMGRSR